MEAFDPSYAAIKDTVGDVLCAIRVVHQLADLFDSV